MSKDSRPVPELTPEVRARLKAEGAKLREDLRVRIEKMWNIPPAQRKTLTR